MAGSTALLFAHGWAHHRNLKTRRPALRAGSWPVFGLVGAAGLLLGLDVLFYVAIGMALAAAFLNAAFNFCLGCEMYLLFTRIGVGRKPLTQS